ncbi:Gfo/Idh/MocA family oxidoreductase [Gramella sp. AN32]|uniref:Gfo/Idh/MocA family protein n=1 Tax=Christiangramia antarctica TaxID=2058158 RepID=A0ABW5WZR7_9FLAO|nr:Gfo/Idh/MocA family oxidoreductase [Gramella sp. AN32]
MTIFISQSIFAQTSKKFALAGLSHGHVDWFFNREAQDFELVGIYETNEDLVKKYMERYDLDQGIFYDDLETMLNETKPDAVSAFGATSEHLSIVKACAPKKIDVMVEKPLATTYKDALEIQSLAEENHILVLTNFETSWYASTKYIQEQVGENRLGDLTKILVNDGHEGPKEIGVSEEFLEILVDPEKNGGGALFDFGCYGANLMTALMNGEKPLSVTAVTAQNKPEIYANVDDEATIILQYPKTQGIIQASWNWPYSRKDMAVYGTHGYIVAKNSEEIQKKLKEDPEALEIQLSPREQKYRDPFSYFYGVMTGDIKYNEKSLYSLPINVTVVEILEAAKKSAEMNKSVFLK